MMAPVLPSLINLIAILGVFVTEMATDVYLPAANCMIQELGTTRKIFNMALSSNLVGLAVSAPLYGAISDSVGRRKILLIGLALFTIGSFLCGFAKNGHILVLFRFLQGLGSGVAYAIGVAIQKDIFEGAQFAKARATMSLVLGFAPAIAPLIGGYLAYYMSWSTIFYCIAVCGLITLLLAYFYVYETHDPKNWVPFSFEAMNQQYQKILTHRSFMTYAVLAGFFGSVYWGFISSMTILFLQKLKVTEIQYPYYQMGLITAFILGTTVNRFLAQNHAGDRLLDISIKLSAFFSVIYFIVTLVYPDHPIILIVFMAPICGLMGIVFPNLGMRVMEVYPYSRGYASAAYGSIELMMPAFGVQIMSFVYNGKAFSITACVVALHIGAFGVWYAYRNREKRYQIEASQA